MSPVCSTAFIDRFDSTSGTLHRKDTLKRRPLDRGSLCRDTVFDPGSLYIYAGKMNPRANERCEI
jgi:hypothetical protein